MKICTKIAPLLLLFGIGRVAAQNLPTYNNAFNIGIAYQSAAGRAIAKDAAGNVYITGNFNGTSVDFDPSANTHTLSSNGAADIFVAKYNSSGQYQWAFSIGGTSSDYGYGIAVDGSGNVLVTGYFNGTSVDFDPSANTNALSSNGSVDIFVAKYNSSGQYQWAFSIGGTSSDYGYGIAVDGSGNVLVTGNFNGTSIDFDPSTNTNALSSNGGSDIFVAKYNSSGQYQWALNVGGTVNDFSYGIAVDGSGNVLVTGNFNGTSVDFDPSASTNALSSNGGNDIFVAKYNSSGQYQWAFNMGGTVNDYGYGIAVDGSGNVLVTGYFAGSSVDFDPSASTNALSSNINSSDIFVAKYNSSGQYQWAFNMGGASSDYGYGIAVDGSGNVLVTGYFAGSSVDFDPSTNTNALSSNGSYDIFVAKYNSSGQYQWAFNMGGTSSDYGYGIAVDGSGNVLVTGYFSGISVDFDPSANTNALSSNGTTDIFVASYADYNKWLGGSTTWATASNWSFNAIPTATHNLVISATANQPVIGTGIAALANIISLQTGATLTLSGTGSLNVSNGITVNPGGALVGNSSNITGTVTLQQSFIGQRGWRVLANPFSTAQTIATVATNNGITISTTANATSNLTDSRTYSNSTGLWNNVTGSTWAANTPYALFVRGLASEVIGSTYTGGPTAFTYNVSGTLNGASVGATPNSTSNFMIVGNPYAAPVTTKALTGQTTNTPYYTYQITQGSTPTAQRTKAGSWVAAGSNSNTTTTIPILGIVAYQPSSTTSFNITTSDINTGGTLQTGLFGTEPTVKQIELLVEQNGDYQDKLFVRQDNTATNSGKDRVDLTKLYNDNVNVYTLNTAENTRLAVDARATIAGEIPLGISGLAGNYNFKLAGNNIENTTVYLIDQYLNIQTELKVGAAYNFTISNDAASKGEQRFIVSFNSKTQTVANNAAAAIAVQISPNPVTDQLTISLGKEAVSQTTTTNVRIITADGKQVQTQQAAIGATSIKIQLNQTSKGLLMVEVNNDKVNSVQKVMRN